MVVHQKNVIINLFLLFLAASFFLFPSLLFAKGPALNLEALIQEAVVNNPAIMAARNNWESAQAIVAARGAMPDPQFSYTYFIENVETRVGPQEQIFGLQQKFPFYGKRGLNAEMAKSEAATFGFSHDALKKEIILQVKKTFFHLFYLNRTIEVTEREKELLTRVEESALTKYETGAGNQQNVLKVQVEMTTLTEKLFGLESQKRTTEERLNKLLGRPSGISPGKPEQPRLRTLKMNNKELSKLALTHRPELKANLAAMEKSQDALRLSKKDYFPDLSVGFNYIQVDDGPLNVSGNGQDAYNVMLSINLPIWRSKLSSQVKSAAQTAAARKSSYQDALNQVLFEVEDNYIKTRTSSETVTLYEKVLMPQAEQSLQSAEAGYETGSISFLDFLDAERTLLKIQYGYWKVYSDYLKYYADLERAIGMALPEEP